MGDDELVRINLTKGVGERVVPVEVTRRELKTKSAQQFLEESLANPYLGNDDKRELALIKLKVDSGREAVVHVLDLEGNRRLIPYQEIGLMPYVHEIAGKPTVSIDYGAKHEIGN